MESVTLVCVLVLPHARDPLIISTEYLCIARLIYAIIDQKSKCSRPQTPSPVSGRPKRTSRPSYSSRPAHPVRVRSALYGWCSARHDAHDIASSEKGQQLRKNSHLICSRLLNTQTTALDTSASRPSRPVHSRKSGHFSGGIGIEQTRSASMPSQYAHCGQNIRSAWTPKSCRVLASYRGLVSAAAS